MRSAHSSAMSGSMGIGLVISHQTLLLLSTVVQVRHVTGAGHSDHGEGMILHGTGTLNCELLIVYALSHLYVFHSFVCFLSFVVMRRSHLCMPRPWLDRSR